MQCAQSKRTGSGMSMDGNLKSGSPLDEAAGSLRLDAWVSAPVYRASPWALELPPGESCFLAVLEGAGRWVARGAALGATFASGDLLVARDGDTLRLNSLADDLSSTDEGSNVEHSPRLDCSSRSPAITATTRLIRGGFRVRSGMLGSLWRSLPPILHIKGDRGAFVPWVAGLLELINAELQLGPERTQSVINQLVSILLIKTLQYSVAQGLGRETPRNLRDERINLALGKIHERPDISWTVAQLADAVDLSRSAFAARFVSAVGRPPMEYLREYRMEEARRLLRERDRGLKEIAQRTGYKTSSAFSIAFKRAMGVTPGEFRAAAVEG